MQYESLGHTDRVEKSIILTNRIIVNALESDRGDIIRVMNVAGLKNMLKSVFNDVYNKLTVDALRVYEDTAGFELMPDAEIEKEVTAYFEINGKLKYRKVKLEPFISLPEVNKSIKWLTQQMKMGELGMLYNPYSLADRLEKAGILTDIEIMKALQDERSDVIREMSHSDLKQLWKGVFSLYYQELYAEAADNFEQACEDYVPERDGIENDPRKNFKPKTVFEIEQEIKAYFKEQGMLQ